MDGNYLLNNNVTLSDIQWDNLLVSTIMITLVIFGLTCYICFCVVLFRFRKKLSNTYYQFILSITFINVPKLLIIGFYAAPCALYQNSLGGFTLNYTMGAFGNLFWFSSLPMYQFIAVNRFMAFKYPFNDAKGFCSQKNVYCMIAFCWVYGLGYFIISFHPCCYFLYFPQKYRFHYDTSRPGGYILLLVDMCNGILTVVVCISFNIATFLHLRKNNRQVQGSIRSEINIKKRNKTEIRLFVLFFVVTVYFLLHNVVFIFEPFVTNSKWGGFLTCLSTIIHLSLDGIINLCFNCTFRDALKKIVTCNKPNDSVFSS